MGEIISPGGRYWIAAVLGCMVATSVLARPEDIRGTPHDFNFMGNGDSCISCHSAPADAQMPTSMHGSRPCQTCHDGASAHNAHTSVEIGPEVLQHPTGVQYPVRDGYRPIWEAERLGAKIFGQTIECVSCHDPHDNSKRNFLRKANTGSALCLACHDI